MKRTEIRRRSPMPRGSSRMDRQPVRQRNPKRRRETFERAYGGALRADWMTRQPSVVSGQGPCVNAHCKTGGIGRRADARWVVPLTKPEHDELHRIGQRSFEEKYGIDLMFTAAIIDARWECYRTQMDLFAEEAPC